MMMVPHFNFYARDHPHSRTVTEPAHTRAQECQAELMSTVFLLAFVAKRYPFAIGGLVSIEVATVIADFLEYKH